MKRIILLLAMFIITGGCFFAKSEDPVVKSGLDVLPTMSSESIYNNRLWVGTFQLVWNDLMDELVHGNVEFEGGTPQVVKVLNKKEFKASDISDRDYFKIWGKASFDLRDNIVKGIKYLLKKFM